VCVLELVLIQSVVAGVRVLELGLSLGVRVALRCPIRLASRAPSPFSPFW
jgi:hypothetical protein